MALGAAGGARMLGVIRTWSACGWVFGLARNLLWHLRKVRFRECGDKVGEKFMDGESGE